MSETLDLNAIRIKIYRTADFLSCRHLLFHRLPISGSALVYAWDQHGGCILVE